MSSVAPILGQSYTDSPMRKAFLKWQCRVRQIGVRELEGRPDDGIMPAVYIGDATTPMGHIITVMSKSPAHSVIPELTHMYSRTFDPAERRKKALEFLCESYYQRGQEFSDILTATFPPKSEGAATLHAAREVRLVFDAYGQVFDLTTRVWKLADHNPLHQATMAHNRLFNAGLEPDAVVLGFEPDWSRSSAEPEVR